MAFALAAVTAKAQDGVVDFSSPVIDPASGANTSDIVVTANRRRQALSEVGASIDTLDGSSLLARGIISTPDLQKAVPGFSAAESGINFPVYSLRGIGLNDPSLGSNSPVVVSLDEVPLPYTAMTQGAQLDLARVEVLKGPQGTLYGQNATGGAINYIASKPTDVLAVYGQVGLGSFATVTGQVHGSGPLSDTLKIRVAANATRGGSWQQSITRDAALGRVARSAGRVLLNWRPLDRLEVDFNFNGWLDGSDTLATQIVAFRPQVPANAPRVPEVFSAPIPARTARAADWSIGHDYARDDTFYQLSFKGNYRIDADTSLTAITAYSHYESRSFNDRDGMVPVNYAFMSIGQIKSTYQELRLASDRPGFAWSVGGNYRQDATYDLQETDVSGSTNTFVGALKLNKVDFFSAQNVKTYAFFADGELTITRHLSVIGGARYTRDSRHSTGSTCDVGDGETSALYTVLANTFRTSAGLPPLSAIPAGACVTLSADTFEPGLVSGRLAEDNIAFRGEINFKPAEHGLLYASFSRGYKAGSFATVSAVFSAGYGPARQERVDAIELGFRAPLWGNRVRLRGAVFYYDYRDKHFRGRILDPVIGNLPKLINIPRSEISGFELELQAAPVRGLVLHGTASYLATEVKEFVGINLLGQSEDFAGQTLPYSPPWSFNAGGLYEWDAAGDLQVFLGGEFAYRGRTSGYIGRDMPLDVKAYATLDLRAGIRFRNGRWELSAWGHNVTDTYYWNSVMRNGDTINRYAAKPATYGFALGFRY